jgi:ribonuclease HI
MPEDLTAQPDPEMAKVMELELILLAPEIRGDRSTVSQPLDPDFLEFGASGRAWNADQTVRELERDPGDGSLKASEIKATRLGPRTALLTYLAHNGPKRSWRSSVWRRDDSDSWQLLFHPGTPLSE